MNEADAHAIADATKVTVLGRDPQAHRGIVNLPTYRASTILFPTLDALEQRNRDDRRIGYGRSGTPATQALEDAIAALEGGDRCMIVSSGKTAITSLLLALLSPGDHMLVADTVYGPTRAFVTGMLARFGVRATFYDPRIDAAIEGLIEPATRLVFAESPGSQTFEVMDIPAITRIAKKHGILTVIDNTWASPLFFKPFEHGVDISIQACTKYIGGHSDLMMGSVTTTAELWPRVRDGMRETAAAAGPDETMLGLRGLRTMAVRLAHHQEAALEIAHWLEARPEVHEVLHPGLPSSPDHARFKAQFKGSSGLFGFTMQRSSRVQMEAMLDHLELFGMGFSWGGFESLLIQTHPETMRTATVWNPPGPTLRIHVGLEDTRDLVRDLDAAFRRWAAAA